MKQKSDGGPVAPVLSLPAAGELPKGGGAIRGIGEKFGADPVTGTGGMSFPLPTSASRSGFGPQLSLSYDSGSGNGPFGLGWTLGLPAVTRATDRGLPRYRDAENEAGGFLDAGAGRQDTFRLGGLDDLVRLHRADGSPRPDDEIAGHIVRRYRPRVEGSFTRIERWTRIADGDIHWRTLTSANVLAIYGRDSRSRIEDPVGTGGPGNHSRVFSWLLCETRDDLGNAVLYDYVPENADDVDLTAPHELARLDAARTTNRYLKRIRYGNLTSFLNADGTRPVDVPAARLAGAGWMFELVLDYGDHEGEHPRPRDDEDPARARPARPDAFSSNRAGFEVRTYRLCHRILMFHHFPDEPEVLTDCVVASMDLGYQLSPVASLLTSVTRNGYQRTAAAAAAGYLKAPTPPVSLEYSQAVIDPTVHRLPPGSLPYGLGAVGTHQWLDLDGDGLTGVLTEQACGWYFAANLGGGTLGPLRTVDPLPATADFGAGQRLLDLDGDGRLDLVSLDRQPAGFHERTDDGSWAPFVPFTELPRIDWDAPGLQLVDLTGDGRADVLIAEQDVYRWHPSRGEAGFGRALPLLSVADQPGPEARPAIGADVREAVFLADMSGDGLNDLVRIRNTEICYWPNLGYGRFGARVLMSHSPRFDRPDQFDPARLRLADVDGSGTVDVLYLGARQTQLWSNQSGNSWSAPTQLPGLPHLDNVTGVQVADLLGNGTACLVWSSPLLGDLPAPIRYVDLMGGTKPHLLTTVTNNIGGRTTIGYAPSTKFFLADRRAGRPWVTRLPFPVHVVERIEHLDLIARTRFVSRYAYHHGHYDGEEREFCGFAMVEQHDSESEDEFAAGLQPDGGQDPDPLLQQPPVTTRSWFHTGAYLGVERIMIQLAGEYHLGLRELPDPELPPGLNAAALRDCMRALRGVPLRQETYSFDGSDQAENPYQVTEYSYQVERLQAPVRGRPGVWQPLAVESLNRHYERELADPRVEHSVVLATGPFGIPVATASITYGRTVTDPDLPAAVTAAQQQRHVTLTEVDLTAVIDEPGAGAAVPAYRLPVAYEGRHHELTGLAPGGVRFGRGQLRAALTATAPIDYEILADGLTLQRRLLSRTRTLFRSNTLAVLPLGQWDTLGLSYRTLQLAFTSGVVAAHYAGTITDDDWLDAGYVRSGIGADWWIPSGVQVYPPDPAAGFFLPIGVQDPTGVETLTTLDRYRLLPERIRVTQAPWQDTRAVNDYRVLGPVQLTDPNGNRSAVRYDPLGRVVASALMGKAGAGEGDTLDDPTIRVEYEMFNWVSTRTPNCVRSFHRTEHAAGVPVGAATEWRQSIVYSDGSGGTATVKSPAVPGKVLRANPDGTTTEIDADPRWLCSGRTLLNNKGTPVKQYEPFFSATDGYDDAEAVRAVGVTSVRFYDPLGRVVRVENPDGTLARVAFTAWSQQDSDANDTVLDSPWYAERGSPDPGAQPEPLADPPRRAAWLAARHANTPATVHLDSLGRPVWTVLDHGGGKTVGARSESDLTGRYSALYDQLGRKVAAGFTGMSGVAVFATSAEKGARRSFVNARGATVRTWDDAGRVYRAEYDDLNRLSATFAAGPGLPEVRLSHLVYGEQLRDAVQRNLLGLTHQVFDCAGMTRVVTVDFKGNPTSLERILTADHTRLPDWAPLAGADGYAAIQVAAAALLAAEPFPAGTSYDALNQPRRITLPDGSVVVPSYDRAGALARLQVQVHGRGLLVDFLKEQAYDAKGRRSSALFGNDVLLRYLYDPNTFRLTNLVAVKAGQDPETAGLQNLHFTYDPVGNLTDLRDTAQRTHFFKNALVATQWRYSYDALYQLVGASGREHAGGANDTVLSSGDVEPVGQLPHANDAAAIRNYTESYDYDDAGNLHRLRHFAPVGSGSWTRHYRYGYEDDPGDLTNRLAATSLPGDPEAGPYRAGYDYDDRGHLLRLHLPTPGELTWNLLDQLNKVDLGGGGTAYYSYDSGGRRVRKVIERPDGVRAERIYLGAVEIYRERHGAGPARLERHTVHVSDTAGRIAQVDLKLRDDDGVDPANPLDVALIRYQYGNHLGSALLETDDTGRPISYEEYHPFGTTAYRSGKPSADLSLKRYRFAGRERDDETGLHYGGARYFAPWLGRWISTDPGGFADGTNLYLYCHNNPVMVTDPTGREGVPLRVGGKPPEIAAAQLDPSQAAGQKYGAWIRAQSIDLGGTTYRVVPGTGTLTWGNGHWSIAGGALVRISPPATDAGSSSAGGSSGGGTGSGSGGGSSGAGAAPGTSGGASAANGGGSGGGGVGLLTRPLIQGAPGAGAQIAPVPKVDLPSAPAGTNFKAAEAAGRANARTVYPFGPGDNAQHYLKWLKGREVNLDPKITNDPRYMGPLQSLTANSTPRAAPNGTVYNTPHTYADRGMYPHHEGEVEESWGLYATARTQHVETGRRTMQSMTGSRGPIPPYILGPTLLGLGGTVVVGLVRGMIPLVAEIETGLAATSVYAYGYGYATLGSGLATASAYTPLVAGSAVAGVTGGNLAEYGASKVTDNREAQLAAGVIGAAAAGAAIGALIGSVVPIAGTVIGAGTGAAIGAAVGLAAYLISKYW